MEQDTARQRAQAFIDSRPQIAPNVTMNDLRDVLIRDQVEFGRSILADNADEYASWFDEPPRTAQTQFPPDVQKEIEAIKAQSAKNNLELTNYLRFMAGTIPLDYALVEPHYQAFLTAFETGGRTAVNKLFFDQKFEAPEIKPITLEQSKVETVQKLLEEYNKNAYLVKKRDYTRLCDSAMQNIADLRNRIDSYINQHSENKMLLDAIEKHGPRTTDQLAKTTLERIAGLGYTDFDFDSFNNKVCFVTPPITLNYFNSQAGITQSVYMGRYLVKVRLDNLRVYVHGFSDNTTVYDYVHPHVGNDSGVCFGNAAHTIDQARSERDLFTVFKTTLDILREYNDGNPYQALSEWWQQKNPEYIQAQEQIWVRYRGRIIVALDNVEGWPSVRDSDIADLDETNDEGDSVFAVNVYRWEYRGTNVSAGEHPRFAVRSANNRYADLSTLQNWDWE